ncbi:MAG: hypothetical protein ACOC35_17060 [Promethearchaeia archaeon]
MWNSRDILYIMVLSIVGAVYSTYAPFESLIQMLLHGVLGTGWSLAGVHTMFILLAFGLTLKPLVLLALVP